MKLVYLREDAPCKLCWFFGWNSIDSFPHFRFWR